MITLGRGSVEDYVAHLKACDGLFPTKLSDRVDLFDYASKLQHRATSFELWEDGRLVGLLSAYMDTDIVFISHICVLPEAPPRSGHALLKVLFKEVRRIGKRRIRLNVEATNERAVAFYVRHGFVDVGQKNEFVVMERF